MTRSKLLFSCALLALSTACRLDPAPADACFLDSHCPPDMACVYGVCGEPMTDDEGTGPDPGDFKLDVGGGDPEIPSTCVAAMAVRTNAGCEFWAVDLPNSWLPGNPYAYDIAADQQFAVVVANVSDAEAAKVSVYSGDSGSPIETATIAPLRTHTFDLPAQSIDPTRNGGGEAYRIESDVPITAYQFQPLDNLVPVYSNDATSLLPSHVLEPDYIALTGNSIGLYLYPDGFEQQTHNAGAFVTAVATEDDTQIVFHPTARLTEGAWEGVTIDRGQTFTILSDVLDQTEVEGNPLGNLSGTRVIADKPIALFSGNVSTVEPIEEEGCCADHIEHQMLPLVAWGHSYVVAAPPDPNDIDDDDPAVIRITAGFAGTELSYPGGRPDGAPTALGAGETATFIAEESFAVVSDPDHPIGVGQYLFSNARANPPSAPGDPALVVVPSLEQLNTRYVFLTPSGYVTDVVDIVAPAGAEVELDGEIVDDWRELPEVGGETWALARVRLDPGAHVLVADEPVAITVFGYDRDVSYAYAGGSAIERISEAPPIP